MERTVQYWRRVAIRAALATRKALFFESGAVVVIAILVAAIYFLLVWHFVGKDEAGLLLTERALEWLAPLALVPAFFFYKLVTIPAEMDHEAKVGLDRLVPRVRLSFVEQTGVARITRGHILESFTGSRQAVMQFPDIVLRLECTNESALRVENCRALLIGVMKVNDNGTVENIGFDEPVDLSWSRELASKEFVTAIEPGRPKPIYVVTRRRHPSLLLFRVTSEIRPEYGVLFEAGARYRLWIQVNGQDESGDRICLDVWPLGGDTIPPLPSIGVELIDAGPQAMPPILKASVPLLQSLPSTG